MIEKNLNYDKIDYFDIDEVHSSSDSDNNLLEKVFFKSIENKEYNITSAIVLDNEREVYTKDKITCMPIYFIMCIERSEITGNDCVF